MSTAEFHDDDLSDEDAVDDDVGLDELSDLDSVSLGSDDADADGTGGTSDDVGDDEADDKAEDPEAEAEDEVEEADEIDEGEESLDVLLAREKVLDEDDLGRIAEESRTALNVRPALIGADEFTCRSCFLVKRRAQLADEQRLLCFDCV